MRSNSARANENERPELQFSRRSGRVLTALLAFGLVSAIASRADAYCRTHTGKPPADLQVGECFNIANFPDAGFPLFWKNLCVGYSLSNHGSSQVSLDAATTIAERAFSRWSGTTCSTDGTTGSRVSIDARDLGPVDCDTNVYVSAKPNQHVIFFADDSWPYGDATNTLGKTFVTFNSDTGEIYDADMAINTHEYKVTDTDPVPKDGYDLESIITHEAGHFLGLAHSDNHQAVMYPTYNAGATNMRNLTDDDISGICDTYHPNGDRTVLDDVGDKVTTADACDPTPRGGFGSACPTPSSSGCSVTMSATTDSTLGIAGLVLCVGLVVRRRRSTSNSTSTPTF